MSSSARTVGAASGGALRYLGRNSAREPTKKSGDGSGIGEDGCDSAVREKDLFSLCDSMLPDESSNSKDGFESTGTGDPAGLICTRFRAYSIGGGEGASAAAGSSGRV